MFHIDQSVNHTNQPAADDSKMAQENVVAYASFFLLARAECAVLSNSGFSVNAVLMGLNTTTGRACWPLG